MESKILEAEAEIERLEMAVESQKNDLEQYELLSSSIKVHDALYQRWQELLDKSGK